MKPISQLSPEEAQELLFFVAKDGTMLPISKIESLAPTSVVIAGDSYNISKEIYSALHAKLVTYEAVKLMYAQDDLAKQASKLVESTFADNFKEYFNHMDDVINCINSQATRVVSHLQSAVDAVKSKADSTLANIDSINTSIKPFKQFAADTDLSDLKSSVKTHVEQLKPVKDELGQVITLLKTLFNEK